MGSSTPVDQERPYRPELELIPVEPEIRRRPTIEDWIFGDMRPIKPPQPRDDAPKDPPLSQSFGDLLKAAQAKKKLDNQ
jgi:hypothetical protein